MPLSTSRKHQMDGKEEEEGKEKVRGKGVKINIRWRLVKEMKVIQS